MSEMLLKTRVAHNTNTLESAIQKAAERLHIRHLRKLYTAHKSSIRKEKRITEQV